MYNSIINLGVRVRVAFLHAKRPIQHYGLGSRAVWSDAARWGAGSWELAARRVLGAGSCEDGVGWLGDEDRLLLLLVPLLCAYPAVLLTVV